VGLSKHTTYKNVAVMVEHLRNRVAQRIAGGAEAMIVTRSRLHAVRYVSGKVATSSAGLVR
jgi:type I restriction enzyme, R subunit